MSNLFNTTFETSLRILLTLYTANNEEKNIDNIAASDFITIYSKNFGVTDVNLHGDNEFSFSEYSTKRYLTTHAIKLLVLENLISVSRKNDGFYYSITKEGIKLCQNMNTEYATSYIALSKITNKFLKSKTDKEILNLISKKSIKELRRR